MSWLGGIFTGASPGTTAAEGTASGIAGFGTGVGEGDINAASGFYNTLLSGNQSEEAKLLAPEIQNIQQQGQQAADTTAQFADRSGGTNAANQQNMDKQRATVNNLIAQLTGNAASGLASLGTTTLGEGLTANAQQADTAEQLLKNQQDSLLGNIFGTAGGAVGGGLAGLIAGLF